MDAERWRRIEALFHETLARPVAERQAYLDSACADPTLRREVNDLVAAEAVGDAVDAVVDDAVAQAAVDDAQAVPERIGPYRVLERLGEGGLATVYLAERSDRAYRMRVAIKVVKRGMDTAEVLRRLRLERQILAQLDHPNVARLLDGGSTEKGQPYVVMEAIDGQPIDRHCDAGRLDLEARLAMFDKVCAAVQTAHRSLVIHRDLKPSNILVTADGEPKLLDFGIAKLLDPESVDQTVARTRTGMRWLTPEYASPEQVRGEPLTTAADVYALGVLLYELLCGHRPHTLTSRNPRAVEDTLMSETPARPSARVLADPSVAAARSTTAERLARRLRGDLDTIVAVAMHREPARRYASVEALADDLRRWRTSRPITARGDSAAYRMGKFVTRHRAAVVAAGLVAASLVLGAFGTVRALIVAERERLRAEQHLAELEEVVDFNIEMFEIADPGHNRGDTITVREVIEQAADRVPVALEDRPAVAARLLSTLGRVHQALGLYAPAEELLTQALDQRRAAHGEASIEATDGLFELAGVLRDQGRLREAQVRFRDVLGRRRQQHGDYHPAVADALHGLATVHVALGDWQQAEALHGRSLAMREDLLSADDPAVAESLNDHAETLFYLGRFAEAEPVFARALTLRRRHLGNDHPLVAETLNNLGASASKLGRPVEAEARFGEALALRRALFQGPHRDLIRTLVNLSMEIRNQGRVEEAEPYLREALTMAEALGDPLDLGRTLRALASNLEKQERLDAAVEFISRAFQVERAAFGDTHPSVIRSRYSLARLHARLDKPHRAIAQLEAQLEAQRTLPEMSGADLAFPLTLLAELRAQIGHCTAAQGALGEAYGLLPALEEHRALAPRAARVAAQCPPTETTGPSAPPS